MSTQKSMEMSSGYPLANTTSFSTNRIFIGNLASELEEFTIYKYCSAYGEITKCQIMKEPKTDRSRGFGFITYAQLSSAQAILNARPHYIGHHKINVKPANPLSEAAIQNNTTESYTHKLPETRRLFIAYNRNEASRNGLVEPAIFGYLSTFGVVKEIVQQFSTSTAKQNPINDYWIVEFLGDNSVDHCMSKGPVHHCSGVRLNFKRVITEQDILRRKRKAQEENITSSNSILVQGTTFNQLAQSSKLLLYSNTTLQVPIPPPPPVSLAKVSHASDQQILKPNIAEDILKDYGYQQNNSNLISSQKNPYSLYKQ